MKRTRIKSAIIKTSSSVQRIGNRGVKLILDTQQKPKFANHNNARTIDA